MKMKMSVIIGVAQMTFGLTLSYENYKYVAIRNNIFAETLRFQRNEQF